MIATETASLDVALAHAATHLRMTAAEGNDIFVWRHPMPMFSPDGRKRWGIRIGLGMNGWCAGISRQLTVPLPFIGESTAAAPDEAKHAIDMLIASMLPHGVKVVDPDSLAVLPSHNSTVAGAAPKQGRAQKYNRSPGRAVRISRAARSAMRRGYF